MNDAEAVPKCTDEAPVNPEPLIVTVLPPLVDPEAGLRPVITGPTL
ncbi:hypothetical protein GCM10020000_70170 [Streptomyces olivoverticillatus]